ncbi:MAG: tetratricopeptide repeat protein [Ignavibacteriae bacterium]|nr:tetratricopeptide repeat protein [Ignavibacteriota bacterium]
MKKKKNRQFYFEVIWVIYGREKLRWNEQDKKWDEHIHQLLLGRLSDEDSKYFLLSCGVEKSYVQKVIIKASEGVPYFLDLAVDTYSEIFKKHGREPVTEDFAKIQRNVFERFLRYLDRTEIETLKILSCARVWDRPIFQILMKEFKTGYPVSEMDKLFRFSFIEKDERSGHFSMHDLMREGLQLRIDKDIIKLVHQSLFDYYNSKLDELEIKYITNIEKQAFIEAFYHGKIALEPSVLCNWFYKVVTIFFFAEQYKIIFPLSEELLKINEDNFGKESFEYIYTLRLYARLFRGLGKYKIAEPLFLNVLNFYEKNLGQNHYEVGIGLSDLADLYYFQGRFSEAEINYSKAIEIYEKESGFGDKYC